jgi:3-oxoacyl-[acyl-carrier protein] reductase
MTTALATRAANTTPRTSRPSAVAAATRVDVVAADLAEADVPAQLIETAASAGGLRGLVLSHCESVDSSVLTTTIESWDRHFQVNARAAWLLIKAFGEQLPAEATTEVTGRIVALTSGHSAHNLP